MMDLESLGELDKLKSTIFYIYECFQLSIYFLYFYFFIIIELLCENN